jgi:phage tail tube protein FII
MASWVDIMGPVLADTCYADGQLVAKDVSITLPSVTPITNDYSVMGTISLPVPGQLESMEMSLTKIGIDRGLGKLIQLKNISLEFRWVQDSIKADGSSSMVGCRAHVRAFPKSLPGLTIEPGSASENELTFEVTRYVLYVDGLEIIYIDRFGGPLRINGVDYFNIMQNFL